MAGNVAESLAFAARDAQRPCRFGGDVDKIFDPNLRWHGHAVLDVAMALPDDLQIDSEDERTAFGRRRPLNQRADVTTILHYVELKPERFCHRAGNVFN